MLKLNGEGRSALADRCFAPPEGGRRGICRWAPPLPSPHGSVTAAAPFRFAVGDEGLRRELSSMPKDKGRSRCRSCYHRCWLPILASPFFIYGRREREGGKRVMVWRERLKMMRIRTFDDVDVTAGERR
nr:hypothetical protein Iba_chr06bCG11830 [Ipomoea batatas]